MKRILSKIVHQYVILWLLNLADFLSTAPIVQHYGSIAEGNPIQRHIIETFGIIGILYFKMFWLIVLGLIILAAYKKMSESIYRTMVCLNVATFGIVLWGLYVLTRPYY